VPLVIAGVMYLPAGNTVVALEADTGKGSGSVRLAAGRRRERCRVAASVTGPVTA